MKWKIKIAKAHETANIAQVELETGWFSNKWRMANGWTILIGNQGKGTWKYIPGKIFGSFNGGIPLVVPHIELYEGDKKYVGQLLVEEYPLQDGVSGLADIVTTSQGGQALRGDVFWTATTIG